MSLMKVYNKGITTLEISLLLSHKLNLCLLHNPAILLIGIYLTEVKTLYLKNDLCSNFNSCFILNSPQLEMTKDLSQVNG